MEGKGGGLCPAKRRVGEGKNIVVGAQVKGMIGDDWKLQYGMKGSDSKVTWLIVVTANSIK
jgi:hypothetical protein